MLEAIYVAAQILADIGSLRILSIWGLSIDGGTLIYPFTFTLRDLIHKNKGKKQAQDIIILAAIINVLMVLLFWIIAILPPDLSMGEQIEFAILAGSWRIVLASIIAEVFSQLTDTEVYAWFVTKITDKKQYLRVLISNAFSIPIDSIIFCWIAFGGIMPSATVWSIVITNILVKFLVTLISLPSIYIVEGK